MSTMSIGGLATGLDTSLIIQQLMAIERRPRVLLDDKQLVIEGRQSLLRTIQSKLRALELAATDLRSVTLWTQTQSVESSDATKVSATVTSGAAVGGYQIEVTQLANAAQRTYDFTSPTSDGAITIDGHATAISAGMTAQEVAAAINADRDATVYAAALDDGTIVLSNRRTGDTGGTFIDVSDGGGALTVRLDADGRPIERAGSDAVYTVDGVVRRSSTNVVTDAIPGVTLTLRGVTTATGPVTVTVSPPGADTEAITEKIEAFITAYNDTVAFIRGKLDEQRVPDPRTYEEIKNGVADPRTSTEKQAGALFGDSALSRLLSRMRQAIYEPVAGLPSELDSLADIGISTGAASSEISADALAGKLTLDAEQLATALAEDPNGVRNLLRGIDGADGWAQRFADIIEETAGTDGTLAVRIESGEDELDALKDQMEQMDVRLSLREKSLRDMFTALEAAIARSQAQGEWLASQLAGLTA